ncbi:Cytosolic Fe-S cluster assembly factor [Trichinella pseudospiralis]
MLVSVGCDTLIEHHGAFNILFLQKMVFKKQDKVDNSLPLADIHSTSCHSNSRCASSTNFNHCIRLSVCEVLNLQVELCLTFFARCKYTVHITSIPSPSRVGAFYVVQVSTCGL